MEVGREGKRGEEEIREHLQSIKGRRKRKEKGEMWRGDKRSFRIYKWKEEGERKGWRADKRTFRINKKKEEWESGG